jgi:DNA repair exonuclease SbcCD ATPase subunit
MFYPIDLEIVNLITHEKSEFHFIRNEMVLLLGKNNSTEGANSNGSGKSTVVNATALAILGIPDRDVNKEDYIRWGQTECQVQLLLKNDVLKKTIHIKRKVFLKKAQELTITVDGVVKFDTKESKNLDIADQYILDEIGIGKEDLLNYFIIGQGNDTSFFNCNDTKQKEIIARFSNSEPLNKLSEKYDKQFAEKEVEKIRIEEKISNAELSIEQYEEDLQELIDNFQTEKKEKLQDLENEKNNHEEGLLIFMREIIELTNNIKEKEKEIATKEKRKIDTTKYELEVKRLKENKRQKEEELSETTKLISQLNTYKGGVLQCPGCKLKFNPANDKLTPEEVDENIEACKEEKETLEYDIETITKGISDNKNSASENELLLSEISSLKRILEQNVRNKENQERNIESVKNKIATVDEKIAVLKKKTKPDDASIKEKIAKQTALLQEYRTKLELIIEEMEECIFYKFHFSNKGFKTFLANKSIKSIQDIVNHYLNKFDIGLQTHISGIKILKNGDVRDKITVSIIDSDGKAKNYKSFSGGERIRIDMCSRIALNKLIINTMPFGKGLDLIICDELPGLDKSGTNKIVEIFKKAKMTSFLILHFVDDIKYKNKVIVEKINNISRVTIEK